jgi:1,4-alpha-glucan branching enzyme
MTAEPGKAAVPAWQHPGIHRLLAGRHHDPFEVLGRHPLGIGENVVVRALVPHAAAILLAGPDEPMQRMPGSDLFYWTGPAARVPARYVLIVTDGAGKVTTAHEAYAFPPLLADRDLSDFGGGRASTAYLYMGAHGISVDGIAGVRFAVWAPNAERVSVVGDFNRWDGRRHPMRVRGASGVWELFIPGLAAGVLYKYEIRNRHTGALKLKTDPFGRQFEQRPATATVVAAATRFEWSDADWRNRRRKADWLHEPMSIYEVQLGSWRRGADGQSLGYRQVADQLVAYVAELGFTHIELLPITEYPLDESWGYQPVGYFAPTSRHGDADGLRYLVDHCHRLNIGVLLDWVPGHFPRDEHGLAQFDGSALYEYDDPRKGSHPDWGTLVFNYGRNEVRSFLLSSAHYWLEEFHMDGLRVDAVASMLYLDYSRRPGEWVANAHGGNENLEAIAFLRDLNTMTHRDVPGSLTIAEESTAWPGVSRPVDTGGLGFSMKWNMGWMHDTLVYIQKDPVHRRYHHNLLTFGPLYAFTENFVLPFSHDEVVHMKRSMLGKMPGDDWQRFANLRLLYAFQWTYPGRKLLFMGCEIAQPWEWDQRGQLPHELMADPRHGGIHRLVGDLNRLYRSTAALHRDDFSAAGFQWLDWTDADSSILSFQRRSGEEFVAVVLNFTPVVREGYRLGVPRPGTYREILNSDSRFYGGSDAGNPSPLTSEPVPCMHHPWSIIVTVPPLAAVIFRPE